ncbi:MAG: hypothetical protein NTU43_11205 [Bacteroidetes bacterium]|nr:hypothetical protein [Bacteroidota bacterium]
MRWAEKNAGQAAGWWAEAYFFLDFLPTFSSMEKVGERISCKIETTYKYQSETIYLSPSLS